MSEESAFQQFITENPYPIEYFNFCMPEETIDEQGCPALYSVSKYAAKLLHNILQTSHFEETKEFPETNLVVGSNLSQEQHDLLKPHARVSHYRHTFSLGTKAGFHKIMKSFAARIEEQPSFYLQSFLIPMEMNELREAFPQAEVWIKKPAGGARGAGIELINEIPTLKPGSHVVVQKYLTNPMLINGLKFDLRFYVAVTSLDPLKIYLYDNGLVRLATEQYEDNNGDLANLSAHLTNFSINKENPNFKETNDIEEDGTGNKWSHVPFWPYLENAGFKVDEVKQKIEEAISTVIIAARGTLMLQSRLRTSFELFGFDVILDKDANVYILEVNVSPALGTSSQLDMHIKAPLVRDLLNLAMVPKPSPVVDKTEEMFANKVDQDTEVATFTAICEYEMAQTRLGGFKCIYPTPDSVQTIGKYLEDPTEFDNALSEWVTLDEDQKAERFKNKQQKFLEFAKIETE